MKNLKHLYTQPLLLSALILTACGGGGGSTGGGTTIPPSITPAPTIVAETPAENNPVEVPPKVEPATPGTPATDTPTTPVTPVIPPVVDPNVPPIIPPIVPPVIPPIVPPIVPVDVSNDAIMTNGVIDANKYRSIASGLSTEAGIAYRYGSASTLSSAGLPTYYNPPSTQYPANSYQDGTYQLGSWVDAAGDYESNAAHAAFAADSPNERFGVAGFQATGGAHMTYSQKPELSWTLYGKGLDAVEGFKHQAAGKDVTKVVAMARGMGRPGWGVTSIVATQGGLIYNVGANTMTNTYAIQLPPNKVVTGLAITNSYEFALATIWDTTALKGQVAVIALTNLAEGQTVANPDFRAGSTDDWWGEWNEAHPGLHGVGNVAYMKLLGFMDLPGMNAPTEIAVTTGAPRFGMYFDAGGDGYTTGKARFNNAGGEARRLEFVNGQYKNRYAKHGLATIISKSEKKAIFLDLSPLFKFINSKYFSVSRDEYLKTTNIGDGAGQWPPTFSEEPTFSPTVLKTVELPARPTSVLLAPYSFTNLKRAWIGTEDGNIRIFNTGGYPLDNMTDTPTAGNVNNIAQVGVIAVGANPTGIAMTKEKAANKEPVLSPDHTQNLVVAVRGERAIKFIQLDSSGNSGTVKRVLQDTNLVDPIRAEDIDNHSAESYIVVVADYAGKKVSNYRYGPVIMYHYGQRFDLRPGDLFEYGGSYNLPGKPFQVDSANIS